MYSRENLTYGISQCSTSFAFTCRFFALCFTRQRREDQLMGLTHSLNVLMISAAFAFVAVMLFV